MSHATAQPSQMKPIAKSPRMNNLVQVPSHRTRRGRDTLPCRGCVIVLHPKGGVHANEALLGVGVDVVASPAVRGRAAGERGRGGAWGAGEHSAAGGAGRDAADASVG